MVADPERVTLSEAKRILKEEPDSELAKVIRQQFDQITDMFLASAPWVEVRLIEVENRHCPNPMLAWEALLTCRKHRIPLPEWVLEYLERTGARLLNLKGQVRAGQLKDALGFWTFGRGNIFSRYRDSKMKIEAVCQVDHYKSQNPDESYEEIYARVASELSEKLGKIEKPYSANTIRDWHQALKGLINAEIVGD